MLHRCGCLLQGGAGWCAGAAVAVRPFHFAGSILFDTLNSFFSSSCHAVCLLLHVRPAPDTNLLHVAHLLLLLGLKFDCMQGSPLWGLLQVQQKTEEVLRVVDVSHFETLISLELLRTFCRHMCLQVVLSPPSLASILSP